MAEYAEPIQFCPDCGKRVRVDITEHISCINWGIWLQLYKCQKYENKEDWIKACIKNGERVTRTIKIDQRAL